MSRSSNGIPREGGSPILTTDEFTLDEMPHLEAVADVGVRVAPPNPKGNKGSEDDPSLLLQDDSVQNIKGSDEDDPSLLLLQDDAVQNVAFLYGDHHMETGICTSLGNPHFHMGIPISIQGGE